MNNDFPTIELLYFTGNDCSVCKVLLPKIKYLLITEFPVISIRIVDIKKDTPVASQFSVFTIPVLLILVDGKEHTRFVRTFSVDEIDKTVRRLVDLITNL